MKHGRRGLFWRVYLHGLLLLGIVAVAVMGFGIATGHTPPWRDFCRRYAHALGAQSPEIFASPAEAARLLHMTGDPLNVALALYRTDGTLVASTVEPPLLPLRPSEVARLSSDDEPMRLHHDSWAMASPVIPAAGGPAAGYLLVRSRAAPRPGQGLLGLAVVLAALAAGSFPLARAITRPLERITATAQRLGAGDLSVRSGIRRSDEVGRLAAALDDMGDRIERLIRGERELLANVSHELRTPLARIRVALEMAAEGDALAARRYLGEVGADLAELERMLEDVFTAARFDLASGSDGGPPLRRERLGAGAIVARAVERFREQHPARALTVELPAAALPEIDADPALLRRALANVLDNAAKYSNEAEPIVLAARADAEARQIALEVRDRGIGIAEQDLPRLFTPFFRTDRSRARGTGGVGLGLTLARRIVEAHGGTISAQSAPGKGTTILFTLPVPAAEPASSPATR